MTVFAVLGHYDYEGDSLLLITTSREQAKACQENEWNRNAYSSVRIEEWDALNGKEITASIMR